MYGGLGPGRALNGEVYSGRLHPRIAAGLAPLLNVQLRALDRSDDEQRFAVVEQRLQELEAQIKDAAKRLKKEKPKKDARVLLANATYEQAHRTDAAVFEAAHTFDEAGKT